MPAFDLGRLTLTGQTLMPLMKIFGTDEIFYKEGFKKNKKQAYLFCVDNDFS